MDQNFRHKSFNFENKLKYKNLKDIKMQIHVVIKYVQ